MQFCQGEDQEDTQCCFFNQPSQNYKHILMRGEQGIINIPKRRNIQKSLPTTLKQTRIISKNNKKQKSQQKGKLSLSKLSARKATNNRELFLNEIGQSNMIMQSYVSSSKPMEVQKNDDRNSQLVRRSKTKGQQCVKSIPSNQLVNLNFQQIKNNHQTGFYQNKPQSTRVQYYENSVLGFNKPECHFNQTMQPPQFVSQRNQFHYANPTINSTYGHPQKQYYFDPRKQNYYSNSQNFKPQYTNNYKYSNDPMLLQHSKIENNYINIQQQQKKSYQVKSNYPTLQTDRMNGSHIKQHQQNSRISLSKSKKGQTPIKSQFCQSQFTENNFLTPNLGYSHLKTVQSQYSEQMSAKKEVHESVILIDFFNPSQTLKKEMEAKIQTKYENQFLF